MAYKKARYIVMFTLICVIFFYVFEFTNANNNSDDYKNDSIERVLEELNISNCKITRLGEYSNYTFDNDDETVSNEELEEYIHDILESFAKYEEIDRKIVNQGDTVNINFTTYLGDRIINYKKDDYVIVGEGGYGDLFDKALMGRKVGETFTEIIRTTIEDEEKEVEYRIKINSVIELKSYILNDTFVQDKFKEQGLSSVEEFEKWATENLIKLKHTDSLAKNDVSFFEALIENSEFEIDLDKIAEFSIDIVEKYNNVAHIYGYDNLEDYYVKELGLSDEEFYNLCYEEGEYIVKRYLLIGAIIEQERFTYTEEILQSYCDENKLSYSETLTDDLAKSTALYGLYEHTIMKNFIL